MHHPPRHLYESWSQKSLSWTNDDIIHFLQKLREKVGVEKLPYRTHTEAAAWTTWKKLKAWTGSVVDLESTLHGVKSWQALWKCNSLPLWALHYIFERLIVNAFPQISDVYLLSMGIQWVHVGVSWELFFKKKTHMVFTLYKTIKARLYGIQAHTQLCLARPSYP